MPRFPAVAAVVFVSWTLVDSPRMSAAPEAANFLYETWYEIDPDRNRHFDEYFARLQQAARVLPGSPRRWVDAHRASNRRIVSIPVLRLADSSPEPGDAGLRTVFGEGAYAALHKGFAEAQVSSRSYIREYRTELSLNRDRHSRARTRATEYTLATVEPSQEKAFERLWKAVLRAYRRVAPETVILGTRTLVGGGPRYVIVRPIESDGDREALPAPSRAVELAFGRAQAQTFREDFDDAVGKWEQIVFEPTGLDAGSPAEARPATPEK